MKKISFYLFCFSAAFLSSCILPSPKLQEAVNNIIDAPAKKRRAERVDYITNHLDEIKSEIASDSLGAKVSDGLFQCESDGNKQLRKIIKDQFSYIFEGNDPNTILFRMESQIGSNEILKKKCKI